MTGARIESERFTLDSMPDGSGVLVANEQVFVLNRTASEIWHSHLQGRSVEEIVADFVSRYRIGESRARGDILAAMDLTLIPSAPRPYHGPYGLDAKDDGFVFTLDGRPILLFDLNRLELAAIRDHGLDVAMMEAALFSLAPNVLALMGDIVMHGSAVRIDGDGALLLLGNSGAGKTTTARALGEGPGRGVLSEDKLVFVNRGTSVESGLLLCVGGETYLKNWAASSVAAIVAHKVVSTRTLAADLPAEGCGVSEMWVLNVQNRRPELEVFTPVRLNQGEAMAELLQHMFRGTNDVANRQRQAAAARAWACDVSVSKLLVPAGLQALQNATRVYKEKTLV